MKCVKRGDRMDSNTELVVRANQPSDSTIFHWKDRESGALEVTRSTFTILLRESVCTLLFISPKYPPTCD